jgi:alkanesulfonate monooxygenase SsuD/methylene tetrahydromethanopterin reductase-like flavin-dependent oxidoreductase (luciferase family)
MARLGDGWIINNSAAQFPPLLEKLNGYLGAAGRDPQSFGLDARITLRSTPADAVGKEIERWRGFGVSHLCVNTMGMGFTSMDQHLETVRQFKLMAS